MQHFSTIEAGTTHLPVAVVVLVLTPLSGRMVARYGTRPSLPLARTVMSVALRGPASGVGALTRPAAFVPATNGLWWLFVGLTAGIEGLGFASTTEWTRRSSWRVAPPLEAYDGQAARTHA